MHRDLLPTDLDYPLAFVLVGLLLLLLGRRLFWLFVAVIGFVAGVAAAPFILPHQTELFTLVVGLSLGLLGALLAIFLQKISISLAGFAGGGYTAMTLCVQLLGPAAAHNPAGWICFVIGGIIGIVLMNLFFNWALMILSSLEGAHMIVKQLPVPRHYFPYLLGALALAGIVVQAGTYRRSPKAEH